MVTYNLINTPLGDVVLGVRDGKVCFCRFALLSLEAALERVAADFPGERIECGEGWVDGQGAGALEQLLQSRHGFFRWEDLCLEGTPLQLAVWREIFKLLPDELISYSALAARCGYPRAVRAVASAVGRNPISLIIPCHRVLRREAFPKGCAAAGCIRVGAGAGESGNCRIDKEKLGDYEWGKELKRRILEWEGLI